MQSVLVRGAQKPSPARKRARKRKGARNTAVPLWELLPDELVRRIVGFVRQRFMIGVYPSPVMGTRVLRSFRSTRLTNRALADGLHTVVLLSVPTYHLDHVDAFTEGVVRLACDLFNQAQREELGNAHVSFECDFLKGKLGKRANHLTALQEVVKRSWFQAQPQIFYLDYERAVGMHLRMLLPKGELVLPTTPFEKRRAADFLAEIVTRRAQPQTVSNRQRVCDNVLAAMAVGERDS